ncbi:MAG: hypothetical protein Q8S55_10060 [Methylococcaceae bacterium]|nr:hypothetical protein [Methylococcaceae bacterium]
MPKTFPLIPRIRGQSVSPLKTLAIHKVLKVFFAEVASFLSETDLEASELWQEQAPIGSDIRTARMLLT